MRESFLSHFWNIVFAYFYTPASGLSYLSFDSNFLFESDIVQIHFHIVEITSARRMEKLKNIVIPWIRQCYINETVIVSNRKMFFFILYSFVSAFFVKLISLFYHRRVCFIKQYEHSLTPHHFSNGKTSWAFDAKYVFRKKYFNFSDGKVF